MRTLFFALCLINVVVGLWTARHPAQQSPTTAQSVGTLLLADELTRAQRGAFISARMDESSEVELVDQRLRQLNQPQNGWLKPIPAPLLAETKTPVVEQVVKSEEQKPKPSYCYLIGPFDDAGEVSDWLKKRKFVGEVQEKPVNQSSTYQVYWPVAKKDATEQTRQNKQLLLSKGYSDVWVIPDGELKGALSLGVFSEKQRAVVFRNQLLQQDIKAELKERIKIKVTFYAQLISLQVWDKSPDQRYPFTHCSGLN